MWRSIDMWNLGDIHSMEYSLEKLCREAVNRCAGEAVCVNLEYFADDDTLKYITDRCRNIRHLRFFSCYSVSDEGLCETAAKLPLLEELEFTFSNISDKGIKCVGLSCPLLKSFKFNEQRFENLQMEFDEEELTVADSTAQAIAESMHQLCYLQLIGNWLTNKGLKAILDGCPHLVYLDLRQCFNVNLDSDLGKRCADRIKVLQRPYDSTHDCAFDTSLAGEYYEHYCSFEDCPFVWQ